MVLGYLSDLVFSTKIRACLDDLGLEFQTVRTLDKLKDLLLRGSDLVIIDLGSAILKPVEAVELIRSITSNMMIYGYYPHVNKEIEDKFSALEVKCIPRSRFLKELELWRSLQMRS